MNTFINTSVSVCIIAGVKLTKYFIKKLHKIVHYYEKNHNINNDDKKMRKFTFNKLNFYLADIKYKNVAINRVRVNL